MRYERRTQTPYPHLPSPRALLVAMLVILTGYGLLRALP